MRTRHETIPESLDDVVDENATFEPGALKACRELARAKPWRGPFAKRFDDLGRCLAGLVEAYGMNPVELVHEGPASGGSGASYYDSARRRIVLKGRLSVVTLLHLFSRARGMNAFSAIRWSVNIFKRRFPISFGRCRLVDGLLINDGRRDD